MISHSTAQHNTFSRESNEPTEGCGSDGRYEISALSVNDTNGAKRGDASKQSKWPDIIVSEQFAMKSAGLHRRCDMM